MKSYIFIITGYSGSYVNLSLQWVLENFYLNDLNVDTEKDSDWWIKNFT